MPETMKLCGSTKSKINKDENFENVPYSGKYGPGMLAMRQKLLDHAKKSATNAIKTSSKRVI